LGLAESTAVRILYLLSGTGSILAILLQRFPHQTTPLLVVFFCFLLVVGTYLGRVNVMGVDTARFRE
jgi:hypothetical protein